MVYLHVRFNFILLTYNDSQGRPCFPRPSLYFSGLIENPTCITQLREAGHRECGNISLFSPPEMWATLEVRSWNFISFNPDCFILGAAEELNPNNQNENGFTYLLFIFWFICAFSWTKATFFSCTVPQGNQVVLSISGVLLFNSGRI